MAINPALAQKLSGAAQPKGLEGILSRGANVYNGGSNAAHSGGRINYPENRAPAGGPQGYNLMQAAALHMPTATQLQPRPQMGGQGMPPQGMPPPGQGMPSGQGMPPGMQQAAMARLAGPQQPQQQSPAPGLPPPVGPQSMLAALRLAGALKNLRGQQ